nr:ribonuclease H-like domain-containing protein [Tanacetum cinerariifolium]
MLLRPQHVWFGDLPNLMILRNSIEDILSFAGEANGGRITGNGTLKTVTKDETTCILKKFITEIENLVDKKVKVIRCDNRIEFKNSVMNDFCAMTGIRREFSVARTPHQNDVAERRNKTFIKAARSMLADSKLPTIFSAEAVNIVCFVQNKVFIVKPYNKAHYELLRGTNSNDFVGTEESIGEGHASKETVSSQDYILLPLWKDGLLFDSSLKNDSNDEPQPSSDAGKKDDEGISKESRIDDQERPENSIKDVNTIGPSINTVSTNINIGSLNINTVSPTVSTATPEPTHADFLGDETKGI